MATEIGEPLRRVLTAMRVEPISPPARLDYLLSAHLPKEGSDPWSLRRRRDTTTNREFALKNTTTGEKNNCKTYLRLLA